MYNSLVRSRFLPHILNVLMQYGIRWVGSLV
ncbi:hypothetical protein T11_12052 [Trichinella zimbabwensis]|uniref:Uncharacterized protein n=1 Tax=Trichinella zimbabwensis TaxID=268475 RepID=A0A0V1G8M1_9BILA|nr:hypothetical protein T11_15006 [Trichinella zimbabwensis]KRY94648.1 hypothetical protein T11_12052 [Trichinella zimbabwensis]